MKSQKYVTVLLRVVVILLNKSLVWPRTSIEAFLAEYTKVQQFLANDIIWGEYYQRTRF